MGMDKSPRAVVRRLIQRIDKNKSSKTAMYTSSRVRADEMCAVAEEEFGTCTVVTKDYTTFERADGAELTIHVMEKGKQHLMGKGKQNGPTTG